MDAIFEDATEIEIRKASACGDVCCICLGTMSTGNVKQVGCGHLYHTHCLREVVERARSMEAARCPLCRASVLDGRPPERNNHHHHHHHGAANPAPAAAATAPQPAGAQPEDAVPANNNNAAEHALFRFSTEGVFPTWVPLPAFSFEIVRRPPTDLFGDGNLNATTNQEGATEGGGENRAAPQPQQQQQQQQQPQQQQQQQRREPSFWRRLLVLAGALPMSPQEEQAALEQLVDMFPQYARADLLRELRSRGSAESVVESVLMETFSGVPRGGQPQPQEGGAAQQQQEQQQQQAETTRRPEAFTAF